MEIVSFFGSNSNLGIAAARGAETASKEDATLKTKVKKVRLNAGTTGNRGNRVRLQKWMLTETHILKKEGKLKGLWRSIQSAVKKWRENFKSASSSTKSRRRSKS